MYVCVCLLVDIIPITFCARGPRPNLLSFHYEVYAWTVMSQNKYITYIHTEKSAKTQHVGSMAHYIKYNWKISVRIIIDVQIILWQTDRCQRDLYVSLQSPRDLKVYGSLNDTLNTRSILFYFYYTLNRQQSTIMMQRFICVYYLCTESSYTLQDTLIRHLSAFLNKMPAKAHFHMWTN